MDYDSREWLLEFLAENVRETERLRKSPPPRVERSRKQAKQERTKPWPRRRGCTSASGQPVMWRL